MAEETDNTIEETDLDGNMEETDLQTEEIGNEQETEFEDDTQPIGGSEDEAQQNKENEDENFSMLSDASLAEDALSKDTHSLVDLCTSFLYTVYNSRYYRQIIKSVLVFALALKMAHESWMMVIPIKEYEPFSKKL